MPRRKASLPGTNRQSDDPLGRGAPHSAPAPQASHPPAGPLGATRWVEETKARGNFHSNSRDTNQEWRRLFAEWLGTFGLTFVAAGGTVFDAVSHGVIGRAAQVVAPGLLVMAMIYTVGDVSGAHFNPAVTLGFSLRGDFPWRRLPGYWVAQLIGAVSAAAALRGMFGVVGHLGATPRRSRNAPPREVRVHPPGSLFW